MDIEVRYRPNNSDWNAVLLLALWQAWGRRCYLCSRPKDLVDFDIDHIIPQKPETDLDDVRRQFQNPEDAKLPFHLHAPHNLAPACRRCNNQKSNQDFVGAPSLMMILAKARRLEPKVVRDVRNFHKPDAVTKAMLAVSIADLSDPAARKAVRSLGAAVVDRLRVYAPDLLSGPRDYDYSDPYGEPMTRVRVSLDEGSRRAVAVMEDVYGVELDNALGECVAAVRRAIATELEAGIAGELRERGHLYPTIADVAGWTGIDIAGIKFDISDASFLFRGSFEADGSADAAVDSATADSGTEWIQVDADAIEGTFTVPLFVESRSDGPTPEADADDVELVAVPYRGW